MTDFMLDSHKFKTFDRKYDFEKYEQKGKFNFVNDNPIDFLTSRPNNVKFNHTQAQMTFYDSFHIKPRKIIFEHMPENDNRFTSKELSVMNFQNEQGTSNRLDVLKREAKGEGRIEDIKQADEDFESGMNKVRELYTKNMMKDISKQPELQKTIQNMTYLQQNKEVNKIREEKEIYKKNIINKRPEIRKAFENSIGLDLKNKPLTMNEKLSQLNTAELSKNKSVDIVSKKIPANFKSSIKNTLASEEIENYKVNVVKSIPKLAKLKPEAKTLYKNNWKDIKQETEIKKGLDELRLKETPEIQQKTKPTPQDKVITELIYGDDIDENIQNLLNSSNDVIFNKIEHILDYFTSKNVEKLNEVNDNNKKALNAVMKKFNISKGLKDVNKIKTRLNEIKEEIQTADNINKTKNQKK